MTAGRLPHDRPTIAEAHARWTDGTATIQHHEIVDINSKIEAGVGYGGPAVVLGKRD